MLLLPIPMSENLKERPLQESEDHDLVFALQLEAGVAD